MNGLKRYVPLTILMIFCIMSTSCNKQTANTVLQPSATPIPTASEAITGEPAATPTVTEEPNSVTKSSDINPDLSNWLKSTTDLPVYLPSEWAPIRKDQKYYLEVMGDKNSYTLNVYRSDVSVKFNDQADYIDRNGRPICEADYVGSISGSNQSKETKYNIPDDAVDYELIPGITAYQKAAATTVWWQDNGWNICYVGYGDNQSIEKLASVWHKSDIKCSKTGNVEIIGGNRLTFSIEWEKGDTYYSFTLGGNLEETINLLNSFCYTKLK